MGDMGVTEFRRDATIRAMFYGVGREVFFTVGEDECRTWSIPEGLRSGRSRRLHSQRPERKVCARERDRLRRLCRVWLFGEGSESEGA